MTTIVDRPPVAKHLDVLEGVGVSLTHVGLTSYA